MLGAWSFAIGTSVGWGSLVVTSNTYLSKAGPAGSVLGLCIGAVLMLIISYNYAYMMRCYPEAGGAYIYTREVFGYDQGFLIAWFICITYFAMLWANATSLPLFVRIIFGDALCFGKLYSFLGYDVYLGEALLSLAALILFGYLRVLSRKFTDILMIVLALLFSAGIVITFTAAMCGRHPSLSPAYLPDASAIRQIAGIAVISPWAFIGFESISHRADEFSFSGKYYLRVLVTAVVSTTLLYVFVTLLSVTAYPPQFSNWLDYIRHLGDLEGLEALPAFYAASCYMGNTGVVLLLLTLLALVITSLIGNITSLSKLFQTLAKDHILPSSFDCVNEKGVPFRAVYLVIGLSVLIPFVGRTAIGWIVDVTTIGAVLIYGFVCACTAKMAKEMGDRGQLWTGCLGFASMLFLGAYFILPGFFTVGALEKETFFLFVVWVMLGFLFFRAIMHRDKKKRFGKSISVWVAMLAFVLIISLIWMRQSMLSSYDDTLGQVEQHYEETAGVNEYANEDEVYIRGQLTDLEGKNSRTMIIAVGMFCFALVIMLTNHSYMNKRSQESEMLANRDPMTGVMSKHAYLIKEKEIDADIAEGKSRDFSIVVFDVNGLKKINDTLGHKAGDEYIRKASKMISEIFQHSTIYRVGGDEFITILYGQNYAARQSLMQTLHQTSVDHISRNEAVVSGGMADYGPEDRSIHDVFKRADAQMYKEKKLLKSLGAVTRDDEPSEPEAPAYAISMDIEEPIIHIRRFILIVEDEYINQEILGNILEDQFDILYAANGEEGLKILQEHRDEIALVLLDLLMPVMSGLEVLEKINQDDELRKIPVIVLTADQDAELECLRMGAMDFIPKPYPIWEIVKARVIKCIELSENRRIIQSTERDNLTNLFNIDYFYRYVKAFDQNFWDTPMDALVLRISSFRLIRERHGKKYSDMVLRGIGENIRTICREIKGVGCYKGIDTFLIYCPRKDDYSGILEQASAGILTDEAWAKQIRLRLGVYAVEDKNLDIEKRFDRAKTAADQGKNTPDRPIIFYDSDMAEAASFQEKLLADFPAAIRQGQFAVHFQPRYDIRGERPVLCGAQALVRWDHPELGHLLPDRFIPLLENNGLILELDTYVWRAAARRVQEWRQKYGSCVPISVNVSRIDMLMPDLKNIFQEILQTYKLTPEDLILAITQSAYTVGLDQIAFNARELKSMSPEHGFRIEVEGFGSGSASLETLSRFPLDTLKIDMTFILHHFGQNRNSQATELLIDIAGFLKVPVLAQDVETQEQYDALKSLGCRLAQGFYFAHALPGEGFEEVLKNA